MISQEKLINIICSGSSSGQYLEPVPENALTETINILKTMALNEPRLYLETLTITSNIQITPMTTIALGILFSNASAGFLLFSNNEIINILKLYDAKQLYELVRLIKTKTFGKGLGSRTQKIIRGLMEIWTVEDLKAIMISQGRYLYNLIRVIHPRYSAEKNKVLQTLLRKNAIPSSTPSSTSGTVYH